MTVLENRGPMGDQQRRRGERAGDGVREAGDTGPTPVLGLRDVGDAGGGVRRVSDDGAVRSGDGAAGTWWRGGAAGAAGDEALLRHRQRGVDRRHRALRARPPGSMTVRPPAVFLDRDGVITDPVLVDGGERPAWSLDELVVTTGAAAAVGALRQAGFAIVVVTNQPDVARGGLAPEVLAAINHHAETLLDPRRCVRVPARRRRRLRVPQAIARDAPEGRGRPRPRPRAQLVGGGPLGRHRRRPRRRRAHGARRAFGQLASDQRGRLPPQDLAPDLVATGVADAVAAIIRASH